MKLSKYKALFHIYAIFFILFLGTLTAGISMVVYNITIQKPDGSTGISNWPIDFTRDFSAYIVIDGDEPRIMQSGLELLEKNRLWIQLIDTNGDEVQCFSKPQEIPEHYSPSELIHIYQNGTENFTVFTGNIGSGQKGWAYIIGFPVRISKMTMYVNKDRFTAGRPVVYVIICAVLVLLIISSFAYSFMHAGRLSRIRSSIRKIAARTYAPVFSRGSFRDVYEELNALNSEILSSDETRAKNEKMREEWIANITHDLKTPLSPIRGYAELIADPESGVQPDEITRYGGIILKNATYAEELINDLKLTYQLKNGMLPLNRNRLNIARFIKELVIDLLNNPEFQNRNIAFFTDNENMELSFDPVFLKRALNNLVTNALIHNSEETVITVSIREEPEPQIGIQDNGEGMTKEELDNLFVRYYRGNNTGIKPEGSGLGMAIAKQIIEIHGGIISAESSPETGTCITINFPAKT